MTIMRPRFSTDDPYIYHAHAAAIHYSPLPDLAARQLANLRRLQAHAPTADEADWLVAQEAFVECADCPPVRVRNVTPQAGNRRHSEMKYRRAGHGPTNSSGRAKS